MWTVQTALMMMMMKMMVALPLLVAPTAAVNAIAPATPVVLMALITEMLLAMEVRMLPFQVSEWVSQLLDVSLAAAFFAEIG
jgi:hypothetical protein